MSDAKTPSVIYQMTTPATGTFPNLIVPKAVKLNGKETGEPKYSLNIEMLPDHPDVPKMKAAIAEAARALWPGADQEFFSKLSLPFQLGDKLADKAKAKNKDREFSRGKIVFTARSQFPATLTAVVNGQTIDYTPDTLVAARPYFYNGVDVLARLKFQAYNAVGNGQPGVTIYLDTVVSLNRGKKLSGGQTGSETFKGYIGLMSKEDPTAGQAPDDEIPF
jgi:hypothetical protein